MKAFSFFIPFLLVMVLSIAFAVRSQPTTCSGLATDECTDCCASKCSFEQYSDAAEDCAGLSRAEKKECLAVKNALAHCCFTDCTEADCGTIGQESAVCEAIDEACMD